MKKLNSVVLFIFLVIFSYINISIFNIRFSVADDYLINNIISGTFGNAYDAQLLYINNIIGIILKIFYHFIPYINFYTLYLVSVISLCFTLIIKEIINSKKYILLSVVLIIYVLTLFNITFTIIAYLSAMLGLIRLACKKDSNIYINGFLIVNGYLLRSSVLFPILFSLGILILIRLIKDRDKKYLKNICIVFGSIVICYLVGNMFYNKTETLKEFKIWQTASSNIRDYKIIEYNKYEETLNEIGWNENDVRLFYTWNFADKSKFSASKMQQLVDNIKISDRYNLNIKSIIKNFLSQYFLEEYDFNQIYILIFIILFIIVLIKCENKAQSMWIFLSCIIINFILIVRNRYLYRVIYPQYLIAIIYYIYSIANSSNINYKNNSIDKQKIKRCLYCISSLVSILIVIFYIKQYNEISKKNNDTYLIYNDTVQQIENDGNLYIVDSSIYNNLTMNYKITERKKIGEYANIMKAGGGDCFSQRYYDYIERFNLEYKDNLYKNLTNEKVYYIGYPTDVLNTYLKENVNENGILEEYKTINNITVYKYKIRDL